MNFLSHHFFYAGDNAWHNTGLILPDWSRSAPGRRKLEWNKVGETDSHEALLWSGCQKHYDADGWFHECAYFKEMSGAIESDLALMQTKGLFSEQRKWFLGHLLAEMLLDRLIMDKHAEALDHFYRDLKQVPFQHLEDFLMQSGKEGMGRFPQAHKGFIDSEFIRYYANSQGLAESLNRVVQRTGQSAFTDLEMEALSGVMDRWLALAHQTKKPLQMERL